MRRPFDAISLTLVVAIILAFAKDCDTQPHGHKHHGFHLAGRDADASVKSTPMASITTSASLFASLGPAMPCTGANCIGPSTPLSCPEVNGWPFTEMPEMDKYTLTCNVDYPGQDIYPFYLAGSFYDCLLWCEVHNQNNVQPPCAGFVFAPEREANSNDCYLKSSLNEPSHATIPLVGAKYVTSTSTTTPTSVSSPPATGQASSDSPSAELIVPKFSDAMVVGASTNNPTKQYIKHPMAQPIKLAMSVLKPGINHDLTAKYPIASDTGSWSSILAPSSDALADLSVVPHLSRDGGKGGEINGCHVFIFCDTASYQNGNLVGFVSSSVATDSGMNALNGKPLALVDQIGEWQDDVGRMRGLAPMTTGEEAFNIALSGGGHRYAVWPESSLIPFNKTHSLLYGSLVYDEVDMSTQLANFTTLGNTLLVVSVDSEFGPGAQRVAKQLFQQDEVQWGSLGGLRSWGSSGVGGMDGNIYVFGQVDGGVLIAKTTPSGVADRSSYTYWDGSSWSSGMLPTDATAYFLDTPVMDLDVFYSPYHKTFIMVYLTPNADNTFYFRYLESKSAILPSYSGGSGDFAQVIVENMWSDEQQLYTAATPPELYIYAGGVHAGYFGNDDITKGGKKMLLSWTQHTGQDATSAQTGYAHMTVIVTFE